MPSPLAPGAETLARAPTPQERADAPLVGIVLVLCAMASFSTSDAMAKYLSGTLPPVEIAWLRWCGFVMLMVPSVVTSRGRVLHSRAPVLQIVRGFGLLGSAVFFIMGLHLLPMATATATAFVSPLMVTALSIPLLGERVGVRRWLAIAVGLCGVIVVVRPGGQSFDPAAIFPLLSALSWAIALICTRKTRGADGPLTAMTYSAITGFVVLTAMVPFDWVTPTLGQIALSALMATASTLAQFLIVLAYYRAPASILAPFSYSQLIWSGLFGYLVFANSPDAWTWTGAGIVVASGLYTAHRERRLAREAVA